MPTGLWGWLVACLLDCRRKSDGLMLTGVCLVCLPKCTDAFPRGQTQSFSKGYVFHVGGRVDSLGEASEIKRAPPMFGAPALRKTTSLLMVHAFLEGMWVAHWHFRV